MSVSLYHQLYEVSRLRSLSSLSELSVSGNPASSLPHSRLFLLYHVRTLDRLDDLPITHEERGHAHLRFSAGTSLHIIPTRKKTSENIENNINISDVNMSDVNTSDVNSVVVMVVVIRGAGASAAGGGQQPIRAQQAADGAAGCSDSTPPAGGDQPNADGSNTNTTTQTHTAGAGTTHQESAGRKHSHTDVLMEQVFDL